MLGVRRVLVGKEERGEKRTGHDDDVDDGRLRTCSRRPKCPRKVRLPEGRIDGSD